MSICSYPCVRTGDPTSRLFKLGGVCSLHLRLIDSKSTTRMRDPNHKCGLHCACNTCRCSTTSAARRNLYTDNIEIDYRNYDVTLSSIIRVLTDRHPPGTARSKRPAFGRAQQTCCCTLPVMEATSS